MCSRIGVPGNKTVFNGKSGNSYTFAILYQQQDKCRKMYKLFSEMLLFLSQKTYIMFA